MGTKKSILIYMANTFCQSENDIEHTQLITVHHNYIA